MNTPRTEECTHFVCYDLEYTTAFEHIRRMNALAKSGVLSRDALDERLAEVVTLRDTEVISAVELAPAGKLLPRGARPFGWIDGSGARHLEGRDDDVEGLRALVVAFGARSNPGRAEVLNDGNNPWLVALLGQLERAWDADTSASKEWTPLVPSKGQCAVTAMVVQDDFGGELLRVVNGGESHYFNRLVDGTEVDLTRDQFEVWDPSPAEVRDRDYLEGHPDTVRRYTLLRGNLREIAHRCGT